MPGHSISVWCSLVKPPLPAPDLSVPVSGTGQHVTDREVHVGALEIAKTISYKLLHRDPKALQEAGWDPGMGTCACWQCLWRVAAALSGDRALQFHRHPRGTRPGRDRGLFTSSAFAPLVIKKFSLVLRVSFALCWPHIRLAAYPGSPWHYQSGFASKYRTPNVFSPR